MPKRENATCRDLEEAGDSQLHRMNMLQRIFAWLFGGAAAAETFGNDNVLDSINGARSIFEPLQDIWQWASVNRWVLLCAVFVAVIALIRLLRSEHVKAYQNFDYQGPSPRIEPFLPRRRPHHDCVPDLITTLAGRLAAKIGLSAAALTVLGPLAPIISGMGQIIRRRDRDRGDPCLTVEKRRGARYALPARGPVGFLYLRYHYIEEGKALIKPKIVTIQKPCPAPRVERRIR